MVHQSHDGKPSHHTVLHHCVVFLYSAAVAPAAPSIIPPCLLSADQNPRSFRYFSSASITVSVIVYAVAST